MIAIIMLMVGSISDYGKSVTLVHSQGSSIDHIVHNDIKWHYVTSNTRMFCQCPSANRGDLPSILVVRCFVIKFALTLSHLQYRLSLDE